MFHNRYSKIFGTFRKSFFLNQAKNLPSSNSVFTSCSLSNSTRLGSNRFNSRIIRIRKTHTKSHRRVRFWSIYFWSTFTIQKQNRGFRKLKMDKKQANDHLIQTKLFRKNTYQLTLFIITQNHHSDACNWKKTFRLRRFFKFLTV